MILFPPSIVVLSEICFTEVIGMVFAAAPQLKVTVPPPARAKLSAVSVQDAGVPVPTTPAASAGRAPNKASTPSSAVKGKMKHAGETKRDMENSLFGFGSVEPHHIAVRRIAQ